MKVSKFFHAIVWGNLLGIAVFLGALVFGGLWLLGYYTNHSQSIAVPNITGTSFVYARQKLEQVGLHIETADSGFVRNMPVGAVLAQSVAAGEHVKPGRTIFVTVNSGTTPTLVLPDIADNCSVRDAETRLRAIGFILGGVTYIEGEKDWVYDVRAKGRSVSAGTRIPKDTPITLVVGNSSADEDVEEADSSYFWTE